MFFIEQISKKNQQSVFSLNEGIKEELVEAYITNSLRVVAQLLSSINIRYFRAIYCLAIFSICFNKGSQS